MQFTITNNIYSRIITRQLQNNTSNLGNSIQSLSSGKRVSSSSDSPSGMAKINQMKGEIATMNQGIRNANMGISAVQGAEAAIQDVNNILIRMKELAQQASTGTYTEGQRSLMNEEFSSLASEIDRIAYSTDFAGIKLTDGSISSGTGRMAGDWEQVGIEYNQSVDGMKIHFGSGNNSEEDYYGFNVGDLSTEGLFGEIGDSNIPTSEKIGIANQDGAQNSIDYINEAMKITADYQSELGAVQNRLEMTINRLESQNVGLQEAESQISDIDVAEAMTKLTQQNLLSQSATAALAQANSLPEVALKLLA